MPGPFPGMDPYLEARDVWRGLHTQLIVEAARDLQPQLVPRYVARPEERVIVAPLDASFYPDVHIRERGGAATAVAEPSAKPDVAVPEQISVPELRLPHRFVVIRDTRDRTVVTVIEFLSPWNKTGEGREEYREKQRAYLLSDVNLVEIDLLRRGQHTIAVPEGLLGPADYRICIHRAGRDRFDVIRLTVRDPLPTFAVPVRHEDPDVLLHLGDVVARCYDGSAYAYDLDYAGEPDPPLRPEDAVWARELLAARRTE